MRFTRRPSSEESTTPSSSAATIRIEAALCRESPGARPGVNEPVRTMLHHGWRQARNTAIAGLDDESQTRQHRYVHVHGRGMSLFEGLRHRAPNDQKRKNSEEALPPPPYSSERYKKPRSAMEQVSGPATMIWSSTRMSTSANASRSFIVMSSSARLGSGFPDGWQCAKITAAAF